MEDRVNRRGCCDCDLTAVRRDLRGTGEGEGGAMLVVRLPLEEVVETDAALLSGPGLRSREMELIVLHFDGEGDGVRVFVPAARAYG